MTQLPARARPNRVVDALRAQYGAKANPAELEVFGAAAQHLGLSIPAGEIALVPYGNVNTIQVTLEGRRTIAQRTGRLRGIKGPEWCGPRRYDHAGAKLPLDWEEVWTGDGLPYAARCFVVVDGWETPANGTCKYSEFQQPVSPVWKKYPAHMLGNAAEKLALRRGFSAEIGKALAALADITGDWRQVDDDTGEIDAPDQNPVAHAFDRLELQHRLEQLRQDNYGWYQTIVGTWKARNRPPLGHDDFTAAHAAELAELINHPNIVGPQTDEPTPADVIDGQPEAVDEAAYRYDPEDGRPFQ